MGTKPRPPSTPNNFTPTPATLLEVNSHSVIGEKPPIKGKLLATQAQSMITTARILRIGSLKRDNLLEARMVVVKINNLTIVKELGVLARNDVENSS